jgi:hypothetical protein
MSREIDLDLVLPGGNVQPLQPAVEVVHRTDEKAVDVHFRLARLHFNPGRTRVVVSIPVAVGRIVLAVHSVGVPTRPAVEPGPVPSAIPSAVETRIEGAVIGPVIRTRGHVHNRAAHRRPPHGAPLGFRLGWQRRSGQNREKGKRESFPEHRQPP